MDSRDPLPLASVHSNAAPKVGERRSSAQVMTFKAATMMRMMQVMQRVAQKSYVRACQLFCLPVDAHTCEKFMCCAAKTQQPKENKNTQAVALQSLPSTILIVNISNSTLTDCVIGSNTYPSGAAERQPEQRLHDWINFGGSAGQQDAARMAPLLPPPSDERQSISIHSSHLNYAIIGDNNHMYVGLSQASD